MSRRGLAVRALVVVIVTLCLLAGGRGVGVAGGDVEQRIADFWRRVDALQPGDYLSAADLGQWALNVIERNPRARTTVADFRLSTGGMQGGLDRAGLAPVAPTPGTAPDENVELRIADFWKRVDALQPGDYLSAADLGQWALNVIERNPRARTTVADFRVSTGGMQGGLDRAGLAPAPSSVVSQVRRAFAGPSSSDSGAADATLAVGDKSVLVATNADLTIYDKAGHARARVDLNDFFSPSAPTTVGPIGDPRVLYDALSRRYFLTAAHDSCVDVCMNYLFLAVSTSDDPATFTAADWRFGVIDGTIANGRPSGNVGDFGMLAATSNYLVLSSVRVAIVNDGGVAREGPNVPARLWVIDKRPLIEGSGAKVVADFGDLRHPGTGLPLLNVAPATGDSGETVFVVSSFGRRDYGCGYVLMGLDLTATPKLNVQLVSAAGQCEPAPRMPQPGGLTPLDAGNPISSQPVLRAGRLWLVESIARAGAAGPVAAVRVVAIDVSAWPAPATVVSDSTLGDPDYWFSYPAMAVDKQGNWTVVFLRGNATEYASVAYAGRVAGDAPGVFRSPAILQRGTAAPNWLVEQGHGCQTDCVRNRWADYFGAGTDPVDSTAWVVGQFATGTCSWGTWVAQIDWLTARVEQDTQTPRPSAGPATGACSGSGPPSGSSGSYRLPGPFTATYQEQLPPDTLIGQPGMAKIVFRLSGVLTDRLSDDQLRDFVAGPPRAGFARSPRYPFVLLLPAGYSPGQYELVLRLPNGEEARSPFTIK